MDNDATLYFIRIIAGNTILWQKSHPDYKDAVKKTMAWIAVGSLLSPPLDGPTAAAKYKSLRDRFARFSKAEDEFLIKKPTEDFTCSWPFFNALRFLKPEIRSRSTISNLRKRHTIEENAENVDSNFVIPQSAQPPFKIVKPSEDESNLPTTAQMNLFMEKLNGSANIGKSSLKVPSDDRTSKTPQPTVTHGTQRVQDNTLNNTGFEKLFQTEIERDPLDLTGETTLGRKEEPRNDCTTNFDSVFFQETLNNLNRGVPQKRPVETITSASLSIDDNIEADNGNSELLNSSLPGPTNAVTKSTLYNIRLLQTKMSTEEESTGHNGIETDADLLAKTKAALQKRFSKESTSLPKSSPSPTMQNVSPVKVPPLDKFAKKKTGDQQQLLQALATMAESTNKLIQSVPTRLHENVTPAHGRIEEALNTIKFALNSVPEDSLFDVVLEMLNVAARYKKK